ncbi:MAG: hypothetical protein R3C49_03710 [Planctomycetaceae bacterium]
MQQTIAPSAFKGAFGEAHMNRYLTKHLGRTGAWTPIRARIGTQGIDGVHVRYDSWGRVRGLIVSEAKYGTSQLGMTRDGIQLGSRWTSVRLQRLGNIYSEVGESVRAGKLSVGKLPSPSVQRLEFRLTSGKAAVFWRRHSGDSWKFAGPEKLSSEAGRQASRIGRYLVDAGSGRITVPRHLYHTQLTRQGLQITVKDASKLELATDVGKLPTVRTLTVPLSAGEQQAVVRMTRAEVRDMLTKKFPDMSRSRIEQNSRDIVNSQQRINDLLAGRQPSIPMTIVRRSLYTGAVTGAVVAGLQASTDLLAGREIDGTELLTNSGIAAVASFSGSLAGQSTHYLLTSNPTLQQITSQGAAALGLRSSASLSSGVSQMVGGTVAGMIMAYGGYFAGYYDLRTTNRTTAAYAAGVGAGVAAKLGTMSLIGMFGTASTGTAISSLHGAAATSATMAWLGGGSVASGGGGVLAGGAVVTGGAFVIAAAVTCAAMKGFQLYDERQDNIRIRMTIHELSRRYGNLATANTVR